MNIKKLNNNLQYKILDIISNNIFIVSFYGTRDLFLMKDINNSKNKKYLTKKFCEQILIKDIKDIAVYIHNKLYEFIKTDEHNIFSSLYRSDYYNRTHDYDFKNILNTLLNKNYNWLNFFNNLNFEVWDKDSIFNIEITPFNKIYYRKI